MQVVRALVRGGSAAGDPEPRTPKNVGPTTESCGLANGMPAPGRSHRGLFWDHCAVAQDAAAPHHHPGKLSAYDHVRVACELFFSPHPLGISTQWFHAEHARYRTKGGAKLGSELSAGRVRFRESQTRTSSADGIMCVATDFLRQNTTRRQRWMTSHFASLGLTPWACQIGLL